MICLERFRKGTHYNEAHKEESNYRHDQSSAEYNDKTMHQVESQGVRPTREDGAGRGNGMVQAYMVLSGL